MRILITGGAGFIGSHLGERLVALGDEVLALDDCSTGSWDNVADGVEKLSGSITDSATVNLAWEFAPHVVVHAAASYKDPDDWSTDAATNVLGTAHVVKACERTGVSRIIYLQTALCYGLHPDENPVPTSHPLRPYESSYAISKTAGEDYVRLSELDWVSLRLANVYGPRNLTGPLPAFVKRLRAGEECTVVDSRRDFIYIDDLLEVLIKAVDGTGHVVYHVSSGSDVSIRDVYNAAESALGMVDPSGLTEVAGLGPRVVPRGPDDAPSILLDPSETERVFGWKARTPLHVGVAKAVDWYLQHGVGETFTHLKLPA